MTPTLRVVTNAYFGIALVWLWINFLWSPWPWSWNPVNWLIFLRSGGPLLYANHVSAEVAMLATTSYFALKHIDEAWKWIILVLSTGSIHELYVGLNNYIFGVEAYSDLFYLSEVGALLVVAVYVGNKSQRRMLLELAIVMGVFEIFWNLMLYLYPLPTLTIIGFNAGPAFWDWRENSLEVTSWILPSVWWFVRRKTVS